MEIEILKKILNSISNTKQVLYIYNQFDHNQESLDESKQNNNLLNNDSIVNDINIYKNVIQSLDVNTQSVILILNNFIDRNNNYNTHFHPELKNECCDHLKYYLDRKIQELNTVQNFKLILEDKQRLYCNNY